MSRLRPGCVSTREKKALPDETALYLIAQSVGRRDSLIAGRLHDGRGHHCAIGCFFEDNPDAVLRTALVDEVAAVNDSLPRNTTPRERWKTVTAWLRLKLRVLARGR